MAHDTGIAQQPIDAAAVELRHLFRVEIGERPAEVRPFVQDGQPAEPGLEAFQAELLEDPLVVARGAPPLVVMIAW